MLRFNGFEIADGKVINIYQGLLRYLRGGYQEVLTIEFAKLGWWTGQINAVEFWAETEDRKDWKFCIDDFEIIYIES